MPEAISIGVRRSIVTSHRKGEGVSAIARNFQVSRGSVYAFLKSSKESGDGGLRANYVKCGRQRPNKDNFVYRAVRCMRPWHPAWGAEKIRAEMLYMRPELDLPHYRTFTRWFHWNGQIQNRARSQPPYSTTCQATQLHEGW